ncbi:methyl-accepting chemotaxis protein [Thermoanaerobacterium sp. DL9XJH110]|uniref:methyl-accepting chemotaxis protein n=1 Tax=Thermoanaerobacterium sp. DL9XJH110 TaxID=3386643 RepID=UPI003BB6836B
MNKSLKTRLAVFLIVMALVPLIVMGVIVNYFSKSAMEREIEEKVSIIVDNLNDNIDLFVEQNKNLVTFLATTKVVRTMDESQITPFLYDMTQQNPQILRIYIADTAGKVFAVPFASFPDNYDVKKESWYTEAISGNKTYISNVRIDPTSGNFIISISNSILSDTGQTIGVLNADISLVSLTKIVMNMKIGQKGYAYITDVDGTVIAHKEYKVVKARENLSKFDFVKQALAGKRGFAVYSYDGERKFVAYGRQKTTGWGIFVQQPVDEAFAHTNNVTRTIYITAIFMAVLSLAVGLLIGRYIATPISRLVKVTKSVAEGNLSETVNIKDSTEIGTLASSFNFMITNLKNLVQEVMKAAESMSASAEELASGAEQSKQSTQQVAGAIEQIAAGANEQAKKLAEISEIVNQLVVSNGKVEENAQSTAESAQEMVKSARDGQQKIQIATEKMGSIKSSVDRSNKIMEELDKKVREIGNISTIIREIVDQTNLLALNASIEAARAGEHGRGFAVVAGEVRKLAEQSGEAAKQIADIVKQIQTSSKFAVTAMAESIREVDEGQDLIMDINEKINEIIKDIDMAAQRSREISSELTAQYTHVENILEMIQNISSISQETAAGTEEVSASSEEQTATMENVAASAQELARLAENLTALVNRFKV